jgi:ketosteroid isomerase-like protein
MATLSEETKLLNMCIGFAEDTPNWPTFFSDVNHDIENILPSFRNSKAQRVTPDAIFASHDHVLVVECEPRELAASNVDKFDEITIDNLRNEFKRVSDSGNGVSHEMVYFGTDKIDDDISDLDIEDVCLVFHTEEGRLAKRNSFQDENLDRIVRETTVGNRIPTHFVPITPSDHPALVAEKVFQKLCSMAVQKESDGSNVTARGVAKRIYGDHWDLLSNPAKQEVIKKVNYILSKFSGKSADENMKKLKKSGRSYYVRTSNAFQRRCQEIIDELSDEDDGYQDDLSNYTDD